MNTALMTLGEVLGSHSQFGSGQYLYLPMDDVWNLNTRCAVLPQSDLDGVSDIAQQNGLSYALGIATVHDVVANARGQDANVSVAQILEAFLFYYDHDAFITFAN